jgi:hypothetical protein
MVSILRDSLVRAKERQEEDKPFLRTGEKKKERDFAHSLSPFIANAYLPKMFNVLSTNNDRKGVTFISTMEGREKRD